MKALKINWLQWLGVTGLLCSSMMLQAETDSPYELSGHINIVGANGTPANDILGLGIILHRRLSDDWYLGVSLEHSAEFDVERPNELFNINTVEELDAIGKMNMLTAVVERRYALDSERWTGFWNLGLGIADIAVDDVAGDIEGGGRFDLKIEADTETVLIGSVGVMQRLGDHWSARYEATVEEHLADWKVTDRNTGRTSSYDDYTVIGLRIGMNYRF